ncbi:TonB-linked outer membrane protein, SusC/RagA family [Chitinophaga jiangningensis]|uniref:TonB-linked outer membrane protein, SusC/RagA family n=1 Tax=Chitinophaga jiangningensis TaxID=1419482 RepID=A0A1M7HH80_9BACT|nr:SusC/RagA family TonB-linked outer membrane protein [Chitinophaga jiangningensis]SHM27788.1 TonB-linked outer membrane protein, SusC/RagA family [Chitinophaga jiangningensis]
MHLNLQLAVKRLSAMLMLFLYVAIAHAQQTISGKVFNADDKQPIIGASVKVVGSNKGTVTDVNGAFVLSASNDASLLVSFIGFSPVTIPLNGKNSVTIELQGDKKALNEVVVTALGIRKEVKRVGYAVQEVKGADLTKAREPNAINGLVGKVAGLTIGASAELLGAPMALLRGNNIGLYVVDGVPINSDTWNISPDDIESYTVLKGVTASALYGSRGLNGAIMITTKKGTKDQRGFSIDFNSSTMFNKGFIAIPEVQDEYGPGDHGKYAFGDGKGGGTNDADYDVWGPKFEGQLIPQYDSPVDPATGKRTGTPWIARGKDNLKRFLQTGMLSTNNLAVSSHTDKSDLRFSLSHSYQKGLVPNTQLNITNFNFSGGYNFNPRLRLDAYINYNRQYTDNFPDVTYGPNSIIYNTLIWAGADWSMDDMRNYWQPGKEGIQSVYAEYQRYHNPWFMTYEWLRGHYKTDINGYVKLNYKISDKVEALVRTQVTSYDLMRNEKMPYSAHPYGREEGKGDYREDKRSLFESNTDVLLSYTNIFPHKIGVHASVGGNVRSYKYNSSFVSTGYLNAPGWYSFANSRDPLFATNYTAPMLVLSTYGYVDIDLGKYATISLTDRLDKNSSLSPGMNDYWYPSVSLTTVVSDYVKLPEAVSFLKFRGSYANVKGGLTQATIGATPMATYPLGYGAEYQSSYDGPTFQNSGTYSVQPIYQTQAGAYYTQLVPNPSLRPFTSKVFETGMDIRFLQNRIGLDVTYYTNLNGPRIYTVPMPVSTGYAGALVNGVTTRKKGWEATINGSPLRSATGLSWDVTANWSTFEERYESIYGDQTKLTPFIGVGDRVDVFYGTKFVRTADGKIINGEDGRPINNPVQQKLGYANPDWVWGINNSFRYKGVSFSFQFDGRVGGSLIDYIQQQTFRGGRNIRTVQGAMGEARYQDYKGVKSWLGDGVVVNNGVPIQYDNNGNITNGDKLAFAPNTTKTFLQDYISVYYRNNEANLISKTFTKLREVTLGYTLPATLLHGTFIKNANVSFVGRNLLYFAKNKDVDMDQYPGADQGSSSLQTPTTRSYGFNVNLTF